MSIEKDIADSDDIKITNAAGELCCVSRMTAAVVER